MAPTGHTLETVGPGATLVTAPLRERNSVSAALMFKIGSRYEAEAVAGVSHFVEHMLFKGSRRYPTSKAVAEAIEGVGGELNASTDKEATVYWSRVPGDKLGQAIDVLTDIVHTPRLEEAEVEKEREVILEELRMYVDSPADHVHTLFEEILWPDHPLGIDVAGTEESVRAITRDDIRGHLDRHYLASDLVIAIAGNVDHGEARDRVALGLEGWRSGEAPGYPPARDLADGPGVRLMTKDTEQAHLVLGTRCVSYFHPDRYTIDLMNTVLGEGMSCRLFLEVRERRGLCYDVHSWAGKMADTGTAGVYIGTEPAKVQVAIAAVMEELHRICEEPVGREELDKARELIKGHLLLRLEGTGALATYLGSQQLLLGSIIEPSEIVDRIDAITAEDVQRVAQETYANQPLRLAAIGPMKDERALADAIAWS
ncbi:MAG: hypothetical protein QOE92_2206 [Chloroflexota bacterium]|jgi:predicted Zn-dependent peptidase|nr:hypothetical protein [Chloroflexota bacterium]